MKSVLILQSNYIPWKGYFDLIGFADEFVIYDEVQFTKNDWRNRNLIKTPQGIKWITIPVYHSISEKISEIKTSNRNWNIKHWHTLKSNYGKAPYFKQSKEIFEDLYLTLDEVYLSKINMLFMLKVLDILSIKTRITHSSEYNLTGNKTERLVEICKALNADEYITGPAAQGYMDESLFKQENIKVQYFDYTAYPAYSQLYPPFEHRVSIVDLIFNCGPDAKKFMKFPARENIMK